MYKRYILLPLLFFFCLIGSAIAQQTVAFKMKCVVIDAGHGGHDAGAVHANFKEKDITLEVALLLGNMIRNEFPDLNVVYTRDKDVFVPLNERGKIANKAKGDLFISIHVNSVKNAPSARGTETFTLGMHKSAANLEVAKKENSVIVLEQGYKQNYEGFDPNDDESYIIFGLGQYAFQRKSIGFSGDVQQQFNKYLKIPDRGVKQAGFLVLWAASMPSVLTEIGFISNAQDRAMLTSRSGKESVAKALFDAFVNYKNSVEVVTVYDSGSAQPASQTTPATPVVQEPAITADSDTYYSVQIAASSKKIAINAANFGTVSAQVFELQEGGLFKYYAGKAVSYKEILSLQRQILDSGKKGAFIVAFDNGQKVPVSQVKKKLKE